MNSSVSPRRPGPPGPPGPSNLSRRPSTKIIINNNQGQDEFEMEMKEEIIKMFEDFEKEVPKKALKVKKETS